ncbi:MAG: hypothetical protein ABR551_03040 [Gemmatimonadales bacterium]
MITSWRNAPLVGFVLAAVVAACAVGTVGTRPIPLPPSDHVSRIATPVKAHLIDGTTVHYPQGVRLANNWLEGEGRRVGLTLEFLQTVHRLPLDSVVGMEAYERKTDVGATFILSAFGMAAAGMVIAGAAVAIFGSCPTFYADSAGTFVLEAEGFSYSIAALFEARDVDRLRTTIRADGTVQLEVRNEALETHFINHLELLDVHHTPQEMVLPDAAGRPVVVGELRQALSATDALGADLRATLASADGQVTRQPTDPQPVSAATLDHHVDLVVPVPPGADSIAVVLRLRNSLLNTVLLYDVMLGSRGLKSLEWQATELRQIGPALELAQWYSRTMGLRLLEVTDSGTRQVAQLRDTGPIAFKDVALVIAAPRAPTMRLRLEHVVDNWRVDRLAVAPVRRPMVHTLPLASAIDAAGTADTSALAALATADRRYLETHPGQRFTAVWQPGPVPAGASRTFLLASQGYYIEWMRRDWLAAPRDTMPFRPTRETIVSALSLWRSAQDSLERNFYASRLPVR